MISYIGIGSNLGNSVKIIKSALRHLDTHSAITLLISSSLYRSKPHGPKDQPDFLNAVIKIDTDMEAEELLDALQNIEAEHDRVRDIHWGPRTLDLDILTYGNIVLESERLTIPHPYLRERPFVIHPFHEISPNHIFEDGKPLSELAANMPTHELMRMEHPDDLKE